MSKKSRAIKRSKKLFNKWIACLGLRWWELTINYYDDKASIKHIFGSPGKDNWTVLASTRARWAYSKACIDVNVPAIKEMSTDDLERVIVHELLHILVNEMREGDLHHEERVVTQLTKAIFWTIAANGKDGTP